MAAININEISALIEKRLENFDISSEWETEGIIVNYKDGVAEIYGLTETLFGELLEFYGGASGIVVNIERDVVSAILLGKNFNISEGQKVKSTGKILQVPVGESLLGRVVNALGQAIDNKEPIKAQNISEIEKIAPGIIDRTSVNQPLQTGIKIIDIMIPIGRGQRELIIGNRQTGKTSIILDIIINQKYSGIKCIYVAIGQKTSTVTNVIQQLTKYDAMQYTTIVVASASDTAALQYIAPYAGCAMGEYFRDKGEDALIMYDDLTKHAWAYRQISLLLRRPPGREAYPGDIFYLHSRLLERAANVNEKYIEKNTQGKVKNKTGSLTALPIVETQEGDFSAFIPTNIISITDGQIYLETDLFNEGIKPAINIGLSVSRVGGAAQTQIIKKLSTNMRLVLAQYRELEAFAQFSAELDETTQKHLLQGQKAIELLKQCQFKPANIFEITVNLLLITKNFLDDISVNEIVLFEQNLLNYIYVNHKEIVIMVNANPIYDEKVLAILSEIIFKFKKESGYDFKSS